MTRELAILLIEDDDDDFVITRNLLAKIDGWAHHLERVTSFEAGLAAIARRGHDIYLVDYQLGARTGLELIRESRAHGSTAPFVVLTGHGDNTVDREATTAGASDYVEKVGLTPRVLERVVRNALERARITTELATLAAQQAAVADLGRIALSGLELRRVFEEAIGLLSRVLRVDLVELHELVPEQRTLALRAVLGCAEDASGTPRLPMDSHAGYSVSHQTPVIVEDLASEKRFAPPRQLLEQGAVSGVAVVVGSPTSPWGVLGVHTRVHRAFSPDEVTFLEAIASVLAAAIARKQTEDELRENRRFLEQAQEVGGIGSWTTNLEPDASLEPSAVGHWSPKVYEMFGVSPGTRITPEVFFSLVHPDDRAPIRAAILHASTHRVPYEIDHRIVRPNGQQRWIHERAEIVVDAETGRSRLIGVCQDVTERHEAEQALRLSEASLRALFETSLDGILITDDDDHIVDLNPASCELLGRRREDVLGVAAESLYLPAEHDAVHERRRKLQERGQLRADVVMARADGSVRQVDLAASRNYVPGRHLALLRDITSRKSLEEQLRQSQKMEAVGRLAGGVAHDYNNVLTAILGYAELILDTLRPGDPLERHVQEIVKAGKRAAALTHQLLAFSRKQILQLRVLSANSVVRELEAMLRRLIGEDVELTTRLAKDLGNVKADANQLEQVLMNLVVNARDALPSGGSPLTETSGDAVPRIVIETRNVTLDEDDVLRRPQVKTGDYVMIAVSDNGTGMSADTQSHLFEPFFTTKEMGKGTGLGLPTVYGIVKQSGGSIWAYSELGVGTTFKVYLPRVDAPVTQRLLPPSRPPSRGTEVVLVVEDEEMVRTLATTVLSSVGYTVLPARHGGEALVILEKHDGPIDLLLTDVVMPNMGGRELAQRALALRPQLRVLYTSGYTDDAIVEHGFLDEGTPFLQKPFAVGDLARKVRAVLDATPPKAHLRLHLGEATVP